MGVIRLKLRGHFYFAKREHFYFAATAFIFFCFFLFLGISGFQWVTVPTLGAAGPKTLPEKQSAR